MTVRTLFPRLLVLGFALSLTAGIAAQTNNPDGRQRYAATNNSPVKPKDDDEVIQPKEVEEVAPVKSAKETTFQGQLLSAIESHLGATYHFNTTGPNTFDCSGLVWRAFNDIGVNFQRGPARSYWATFDAPPADERFKFGNLVFFSGLTHVGIVADEKGFYHSSRRHGVIYSPFSDYWLSRIDGFRRVPLEGIPVVAREKNRQAKPAANVSTAEEGTPR
ncbi:MAG TPA: NlpC/P60 family protein [Pyrinomonadaceae bacterium]|nr:NlpC/P60 family protein [Pyrinomonadaceae bacterium]